MCCAVGVGVREDADLVIAQAVELVGAGIDADRDRDVMHFLRLQHLARFHFPGVQDLAAQRHDRLELAIARLLRRAARRIAFDQEQLAALGFLRSAIGELARQRGPADDALARHGLRRLEARLRAGDRELRDLLAGLRMLVQPQPELILDDAGNERRRLARRQALLGLAGELRLLDLGRQHVAHAVPDIFGRELQTLRQQVAELAELANRIGQADAQAVDVRAALRASGSG